MRTRTTGRESTGTSRWRATPMLLLVACLVASLGFANSNANERAKGPPPSGTLEMEGDYGSTTPVDDPTHDPAIIKDPRTQTYYVFSTGQVRPGGPDDPGGVWVRKSEGTLAGPWETMGEIDVPTWTLEYGHAHVWAPQVVRQGNTFYLYYGVSTWGTQNSAIGVMSTRTPGDLGSWEDHGPVLTSATDQDPYNAIDPHVFKDRGSWYMAFGSYWDGIFLYEMEDMTTVTGEPVNLAQAPDYPEEHNYEAPTIIRHEGYYYLLNSRGVAVTDEYHITVGRSESLTGPYVDRDGVPLLEGGGTLVLAEQDGEPGVGGQDVIFDRGRHYLIHHYYEWEPLNIRMQIRELQWDDGWPYVLQD